MFFEVICLEPHTELAGTSISDLLVYMFSKNAKSPQEIIFSRYNGFSVCWQSIGNLFPTTK